MSALSDLLEKTPGCRRARIEGERPIRLGPRRSGILPDEVRLAQHDVGFCGLDAPKRDLERVDGLGR